MSLGQYWGIVINNPTGGWKLCSCGKKFQRLCDHKPKPIPIPRYHLHFEGFPEALAERGGFVYLLQALDTEIFKIGASKDLRKRIKDIQLCCPLPLKLLSFQFSHRPYKKEESLHKHFAKQRLHGEWFQLSPDDVLLCLSLL